MIFISKKIHKIKFIMLSIFILISCLTIILMPQISAEGAKNGLIFSGNTLVPSLFPFMVISSFIVKSGLSLRLGKLLERPTKILFNLPGYTAPTILISLFGGYPTGARGISSLKSKNLITNEQAQEMLCFAVSAGPAFVINVIGIQLLYNMQSGIIIFLAQTLAAILIGILVGKTKKDKCSKTENNLKIKYDNINISNALVESCKDATQGMINMCAFVILFSCVCNIINKSGINKLFASIISNIGINESISKSIIPILLEVTGGCINAIQNGVPYELIAFALAWSGLCVHFQIYSCLSKVDFSIPKFVTFRFLHGIISALLSYIGFKLFPASIQTFCTFKYQPTASISYNVPACILIILLCLHFLLILGSNYIDLHSDK